MTAAVLVHAQAWPAWAVLGLFAAGCVLLGVLLGYAAGRRPDRDPLARRRPSPRPRREPYPFAEPSPTRHR